MQRKLKLRASGGRRRANLPWGVVVVLLAVVGLGYSNVVHTAAAATVYFHSQAPYPDSWTSYPATVNGCSSGSSSSTARDITNINIANGEINGYLDASNSPVIDCTPTEVSVSEAGGFHATAAGDTWQFTGPTGTYDILAQWTITMNSTVFIQGCAQSPNGYAEAYAIVSVAVWDNTAGSNILADNSGFIGWANTVYDYCFTMVNAQYDGPGQSVQVYTTSYAYLAEFQVSLINGHYYIPRSSMIFTADDDCVWGQGCSGADANIGYGVSGYGDPEFQVVLNYVEIES